ncbi:TRAP transporter small permease [Marinimicrococcus flavescens]|uniref:TRAP transporter small permease protein n=1 Tax=Marinimicrococcus flavescens TaxID=3031815 RepID=A0AAP3V2W7_9PROT|nr:TRAP transporter small permease [Marinimicrococcus flavescens]
MSELRSAGAPADLESAGRLVLPGGGGRAVRRAVDAALILGLGVIVVVLIAQVIMRYVFHAALPWPEELAQFLLVAISLLGGFRAFELDRHIRLDLPLNRSPHPLAAAVRLAALLLTAGFVAYAGWGGLRLAAATWNQPSTALRLPMGMVYLIVPLSCLAMLASLAWGLAQEIGRLRSPTRKGSR